MKLYKPLHVCAYLFGIFPVVTDAGRLRIHWPGLILKAFHTVLYSVVSVIICMITFKSLMNYEKLTKKILDTRVLNIDELFGYMVITGLTATVTCQVYMLWPSVIRIINECFLNLRPLQDDITGAWQYISAFSIILFIIYEFTMYYILVTYKFTYKHSWLICLFPMLSNVSCIVFEQFFYLTCVSLYLRLRILHDDIKTLVRTAERPRWKYRVAAGGGVGNANPPGTAVSLGIPAFGTSDVRRLRADHRACVELFGRVNFLFQLPLSLCIIDSMHRFVVYVYGVSFDVTIVVWDKKKHVNYTNTALWTGYFVIRIVRLWYLHMCEHYVNKKILPIKLSLSWLSLILNPITSRRLIAEIVLFQHQLDVVKSKFEIFGIININMTLLYAGFGTALAYIALLLQLFVFNQISLATISSSLNGTNFDK